MSIAELNENRVADPLKLVKWLWPQYTLYDKQRQILYSLWENDETVVPAANMMGKDFITGMAVLIFFLSRHPCRVLTTSVDDTQLNDVLWGEIRRFIQECSVELSSTNGGNLVINEKHIRKIVNGELCGRSYIRGRVADVSGEGLLGHHIEMKKDRIPRTLGVGDECSGMSQVHYDNICKWANRRLWIGNCFPCNNFFKWSVKGRPGEKDKGGDVPRTNGKGFFRKLIRIKAEDSPNVKLGLKQKAKGLVPDDKMLIEGVKSYGVYEANRLLWDPIQQCIGLDADWYEGAEVMMYPSDWLNGAEGVAAVLQQYRRGKAIGCDPGEGGAESSWSVVDELGLIAMLNIKTPDTSVIPNRTIELMQRFGVKAENVWFDRGGGGKQHADQLRSMGHYVQTTSFGEPASEADRFNKFRRRNTKILRDDYETKTVYVDRRAEMYGIIRHLIDPAYGNVFGIPARFTELRRQLTPIPLQYDNKGRMYLPPKHKKAKNSTEVTLVELIGCSPDQADSLALACFGLMDAVEERPMVGAIEIDV